MYMLVDKKTHKVVTFVKEAIDVFGYDTFSRYTIDDTVRFNVYVIDKENTYLAREERRHELFESGEQFVGKDVFDDTLCVTNYLDGITFDKLLEVMMSCPEEESLIIYYYFTSNAKEYYDEDIPF